MRHETRNVDLRNDFGGRGNSLLVAASAYLAAAAVLVVPTLALAVRWLTELHRLFTI